MLQQTRRTLDNRKAKPDPLDLIRARGFLWQAFELGEYHIALRFRQPGPGVMHFDLQPIAPASTADQHATCTTIFHRIRHQILNDLTQIERIAFDPFRGWHTPQIDPVAHRDGLKRIDYGLQDICLLYTSDAADE